MFVLVAVFVTNKVGATQTISKVALAKIRAQKASCDNADRYRNHYPK